MTHKKTGIILLSLLLAAALTGEARAVNCHCFNQRDYDAASPGSADPYILATSGNSLIAGAFGTEKSAIVRLRMGGEDETSIWIAFSAAGAMGADPVELLGERAKTGSWKKVFAGRNFDSSKLGKSFPQALEAGEETAARALADEVFARSFGAGPDSLALLRKKGATIPETTVALFLAPETKKAPEDLFAEVKAGGSTWGKLLDGKGIRPASLSARIISKIRP